MKLYHISEEDLNGQILQPRIPDNFLTKQGYEDNKTPRISLCKSVNGCLTAISANLKNKVFNVYLIDESYAIPNIKEITNNEVPDQSLTEEVWVLNPIKLKYGFKIRVLGAYPKSLKYKYGKDWAETYRWKYNVIDDSDVMTKDKALFILKECFIQVKDIDKKGYVKGVGLFGSTARDQRTKESDVDIFLDLDQSLLKLEENSIFGIPKKDWEVILKVFVDNFGINPHTNKNYVIDVVGKYELRHKWNEVKDEIIMIDTDGKKYTYDEYVNSKNVVENFYNIKLPFLIESTILDFPQVRQSNEYSCGAAVVRAVLAYYGKDIKEEDLMDKLSTSETYGTDPNNIISYLKKNKLKVDGISSMTIAKLKSYIDKKIPVIVLIQAWADDKKEYKKTLDNGHYVVVIGYTNNKLFFEDPSIYERGYLTYNEFESRWKDVARDGTIYRKYGMAVYGEKPKFSDVSFVKIE